MGPAPLGWGVLSGPNPVDPNDPAALGREFAGDLGGWDVAATAAQHDVTDFTLRLAAYDPANMDYPVAVSNVVYVVMAAVPTDTPAPTETPFPTGTPELTPTSELTPTVTPGSPTVTPTPEATFTPVVGRRRRCQRSSHRLRLRPRPSCGRSSRSRSTARR